MRKIYFLGFLLFFTAQVHGEETIGDVIRRINQSGNSGKTVMSRQSADLPDDAAYQNRKREHIDLQAVKPILNQEFLDSKKFGKDRIELERITDKQIKSLFKLTEGEKNYVNRGELWLRLAELYIEKADYIRYRKQTDYEKQIAAFKEKKLANRPKINVSEADEYNKKAIQLYEYFVRDFKGSPKIDQALYYLGFSYVMMGDFKKGAAYFTRLTEEYPRSPYINEANFSIGEYYFEADQWKQALEAYKKVVKAKDEKLFDVALYKAAWSLYLSNQYDDALRYLELLLRIKPSEVQGGRGGIQEEAKRDLVPFYAEGGDHTKALTYFEKVVGEKAAPKQVEKIAYYYSDKGYREKASYLFKQLIALDPMASKAYDYQYQMVINYVNLKSDPEFKAGLYALIKGYGPKSKWAEKNKDNKDLIKTSYESSEKFLRTYILQHHQAAQNAKGQRSQETALDGYKLYLSVFEGAEKYPDMVFYNGELLYDMKKYGEAAKQYRWVAKNAPKSKFGSKAAMNMILGLEKDLPTEEQMQARIGKTTDPVPLDPRVKEFIDNSQWYLANFPKAEKKIELEFKIGRLFYLSNQFGEAEKVFKTVIETDPKSKQAEYASNLLLDIYNLRKDYAGLERVGSELLAHKALEGSTSANQIRNVLERASFKAAEELENKKDFYGSAKKYDEFVKKYPKSGFTMKAHFNAGVNYQRANKIVPAIAAFEFVQKSKNKEDAVLQDKIYKIVPKLYQDMGMFQKAANAYVQALDHAKVASEKMGFTYNAAVLFDALNIPESASKYYIEYIGKASYGEKANVYLRLAELNYRNSRWSKANEYYREFLTLSKDPSDIVESHFKVAVSLSKLGRRDDSEVWKTKVVNVQKQYVPQFRGPGSEYAAQIRLERLEPLYQRLAALKFSTNNEAIKRVLSEKLDLVSKINKELSEILKYDSPNEVVGALEFLGRTNENMVRSYLTAPIPPKVLANEDAKQKYMKIIEEQALPFKQTALESYAKAISRGRELEAFPKAYFASIESMKRLDPQYKSDWGQESSVGTYFDWMGVRK